MALVATGNPCYPSALECLASTPALGPTTSAPFLYLSQASEAPSKSRKDLPQCSFLHLKGSALLSQALEGHFF